nr:cytochrome b5 domain-containing protein [Halomonas socia]
MSKIAYSAFIAFLASIGTLVSVHALSSDEEVDSPREARDITLDELAEHDSAESCWKAIHGGVYDITDYVPNHPTEKEVILEWCGRESSEAWDNKRPGRPHSPGAERQLENYRIGRLVDDQGEPLEPAAAAPEQQSEAPADAVDDEVGLDEADTRLAKALLSGHYPDGRYRGVFSDGGEMQVNVQFDLRDGRIGSLSYRHLAYAGTNYRRLDEDDELYPVLEQHRQLGEALEGRELHEIFLLYTSQRLAHDVDGYSGATLRGNKVHSAMRDALNRGVYSWP